MKAFWILALAVLVQNPNVAVAAGLVYEDTARGLQFGLGSTPHSEDPDRFIPYRCEAPIPTNGRRITSFEEFRANPSSRCVPLSPEGIRYSALTPAAHETVAEWRELLQEPRRLERLATEIERARQLGLLQEWSTDPNFHEVQIAIGNTIFPMLLFRAHPVAEQLMVRLAMIGSPQAFQFHEGLSAMAQRLSNQDDLNPVPSPVHVIAGGELIFDIYRWSLSQESRGAECRDLIQNFGREYFSGSGMDTELRGNQDLTRRLFEAGEPIISALRQINGSMQADQASQGRTNIDCVRALRELARVMPFLESRTNALLSVNFGETRAREIQNRTEPYRQRILERANESLVGIRDAR